MKHYITVQCWVVIHVAHWWIFCKKILDNKTLLGAESQNFKDWQPLDIWDSVFWVHLYISASCSKEWVSASESYPSLLHWQNMDIPQAPYHRCRNVCKLSKVFKGCCYFVLRLRSKSKLLVFIKTCFRNIYCVFFSLDSMLAYILLFLSQSTKAQFLS